MQISFCEWVGVAHHFCVSPYLAQGPSSPSRLWCLVSPRDSLLALLQLLLGGCPPVGSPPCIRVYNHNISTLRINIIKTYSYLYAVYSRNILVPEGLMSVCLCMGLGWGFWTWLWVVLAGLELVFPHLIWNYNPFYGDIALWHFPTLQPLPMWENATTLFGQPMCNISTLEYETPMVCGLLLSAL